jgi:hypothetical protein
MTIKSPRELSDAAKNRKSDGFLREAFVLPRPDARKPAKRLFSEFPSAAYMTEIETWCERGGMVEFKLRRHCTPYLANDTEAKDHQPPSILSADFGVAGQRDSRS